MGFLQNTLVTGEDEHEFFTDQGLKDVAKWAAGGFTLLSGLLAFFGVKEGVLDRVLRGEPGRALYVFVLVGIGLLSALFAPALATTVRVRTLAVSVPVGALGITATVLGRDDPLTPRLRGFTYVAFALFLAAAIYFARVSLSLVAAVLVVGVAATSMGLYSAATIAVSAKDFVGAPRLTATIEQVNGRDVVAVAVKASHQEKGTPAVELRGSDAFPESTAKATEIDRRSLPVDGVGDVDATVRLPVALSRWAWLAVSFCKADDACDDRPAAILPGRVPRVGANVAPAGTGAVAVSVTVANLAPDVTVEVTVTQGTATYLARLVGDKDGAATWAPQVPKGPVTVTYAVCAQKCTSPVPVATFPG